MKIMFDEINHIYYVNGKQASISVTQLLHKHGLAPSYVNVSKERLEESARIGTEIHKELEEYVNYLMTPKKRLKNDFNESLIQKFKPFTKGLKKAKAEQILAYEYHELIIAGTADLLGYINDIPVIVDYKTTRSIDKRYVSWQVSLLDFFARKNDERINGKIVNWNGAKKFYCLHIDKDTYEMKLIELEKIPDSELENLIVAEYAGRIYEDSRFSLTDREEKRLIQLETKMQEYKQIMGVLENEVKEIKDKMFLTFVENDIVSWESPNKTIKATLVHRKGSVVCDWERLQKERPEIANEYSKRKKGTSYLSLTIRNNKGE